MRDHFSSLPHAYGVPALSGVIRSQPEDFVVTERLGFEPEGEGEHLYLHVTKRGTNTAWLADRIAEYAGVAPSDIGYCGLKDRHALTSQWLSVYRPRGGEIDWKSFAQALDAPVQIHTVTRGRRKLRRGQHTANAFELVVRDCTGPDIQSLSPLLENVSARGVPNYFGAQRFGRNDQNLEQARQWLTEGRAVRPRRQRALVMSAARAYLFNLVVAKRVLMNNWSEPLAGDVLQDGSPTAPMWGRGRTAAEDQAEAVEEQALLHLSDWKHGLEHCGLSQERRSTVLHPRHLCWQLLPGLLRLSFELPPGQYATSLLRELVNVRDVMALKGHAQ